eukprot:3282982-Rhodomonas_salina.1
MFDLCASPASDRAMISWYQPPIVLRAPYAVPGTDVGYGATRSYDTMTPAYAIPREHRCALR